MCVKSGPYKTGHSPLTQYLGCRENISVPDGLSGHAVFDSEAGKALIRFSRAGYQALEPYGDLSKVQVCFCQKSHAPQPASLPSCPVPDQPCALQAGKGHVFALMMSAKPSARGSTYLHRGLYPELEQQLTRTSSIPAAFEATLQALDKAFQRIHPANGPVLAGLRLVVAYLDCASSTLYTAGNGGCRCVVGRQGHEGRVYAASISRDVGALSADSSLFSADMVESVRLDPGVRSIVLGSRGFW